MKYLIIFQILVTGAASAEQVYKQVDEDGVPTFSDQALPGAEKVKIEKPVTFSDELIRQEMDRRQEEKKKIEEEARNVSYTIAITDPVNDSAIRDNAGNVTISVRMQPRLVDGHQAELHMDGRKIRGLSGTGSVQLNNVDRGTHQFSARIVDRTGRVLAQSDTVEVSVLRYTMPRKQPK